MKTIRILIADDHDMIRRGLRALLDTEPDMEVCGEASDGGQAVEMAARLKPDVIIMDISMPRMNGVDATRYILDENPAIEVLILTMHESGESVRNALHAGARGYVLKSDVSDKLACAARALAHHQFFISVQVEKLIVKDYLSGSTRSATDPTFSGALSPREREILAFLAEGKSNKEAAHVFNISVKTVETHRARIMAKLDLHSVSDLVRYAVRNNLLEA